MLLFLLLLLGEMKNYGKKEGGIFQQGAHLHTHTQQRSHTFFTIHKGGVRGDWIVISSCQSVTTNTHTHIHSGGKDLVSFFFLRFETTTALNKVNLF